MGVNVCVLGPNHADSTGRTDTALVTRIKRNTEVREKTKPRQGGTRCLFTDGEDNTGKTMSERTDIDVKKLKVPDDEATS